MFTAKERHERGLPRATGWRAPLPKRSSKRGLRKASLPLTSASSTCPYPPKTPSTEASTPLYERKRSPPLGHRNKKAERSGCRCLIGCEFDYLPVGDAFLIPVTAFAGGAVLRFLPFLSDADLFSPHLPRAREPSPFRVQPCGVHVFQAGDSSTTSGGGRRSCSFDLYSKYIKGDSFGVTQRMLYRVNTVEQIH